MAPHFTETAPGVHTTTLTDPKTERRQNIAIIESCDAWQLFVDGELKTRDLPSFKAAVAAAQSNLTNHRGPSMVRVACALVLLSIAGASTIGMAKVISPLLGTETAVAAVASETNSPEAPQRFTRVRGPSMIEKVKKETVAPQTTALAEKVIVTVAAAPKPVGMVLETPQPQQSETTQSVVAPPVDTGSSWSDVQPIGLRPITSPTVTAAKPQAPPSQKIARASKPLPIVIEPNPEAAPVDATSPDGTPEALPTINAAVAVTPPLPVIAPVLAVPLIRTARAPIEAERLNSILANIEKESNETETDASFSRSTAAPRAIKRQAPKRNKAAKRSRRVKHSTPRTRRTRQARRRPIHTARAHRATQERRMVCFAHTCRFR